MIKSIFSFSLIIILLFSPMVYANSGPTYWEGYPSLEVLSIQENSPIVVEKEDLIFDFTKPELAKHDDYSKTGLVTAIYEMSNPTDEEMTVQMAFPMISKIPDFKSEDIKIMEDKEDIIFEIFIGASAKDVINSSNENGQNKMNFDRIINSITKSDYMPENFKLDDIGTLYRFDIQNTSDKGIHFRVDFKYNDEKTKILSNGFNSYHMNQDNNITEIGSYIHKEETLEILVIGEDIDLNINAYTDTDYKETTNNYLYKEESKSIVVRDYLINYFNDYLENTNYKDLLPYNQLLNIYLRCTDDMFSREFGYIWLDELTTFDYFDLFFVLLYEVKFMPHETKDVSISYITKGTMDRKETVDPQYIFEYILNPAGNWASFKDLNIKIIPPVESPYIIESSLELERNQNGSYTKTFESLPENDLTFTLYSKEKVTFMDKIEKFFYKSSYLVFPLLRWLGLAIMSYIVVKVIAKISVQLVNKNKD